MKKLFLLLSVVLLSVSLYAQEVKGVVSKLQWIETDLGVAGCSVQIGIHSDSKLSSHSYYIIVFSNSDGVVCAIHLRDATLGGIRPILCKIDGEGNDLNIVFYPIDTMGTEDARTLIWYANSSGATVMGKGCYRIILTADGKVKNVLKMGNATITQSMDFVKRLRMIDYKAETIE